MTRLLLSSLLSLLLFSCAGQIPVGSYVGPFGRLHAYVSDGCTGALDGTQQNPDAWTHCCDAHDLKYWAGGAEEERLKADQELKTCVAATGHGDTATIMYLAVRMLGNPYNRTSWRWGFGWKELRGYSPLTPEERREIERFSPK